MPRPGKGERTPGSGRKPGSLNKATKSLKELAQPYAPAAIETLRAIMEDVKAPHQARVAASNALLDRAGGKPPQAITGADDKPLIPQQTVYKLEVSGQ